MTILSVCQQVATVIGINVPSQVYGGTDREQVELQSLANEMAKRIARAHDWQLLMTVATYAGDDVAETFALPTDYDRMPKKAQLWSSTLSTPLTHIQSADRWLDLDIRAFDFVVNAWIIIGGEMAIKPAMATGVSAKHYYQSNLIVSPASGPDQVEFVIDTDTFRLSERLLKLGMIWQWKANKGLPYAEDMANFEELKEKQIGADKGSRMLVIGARRRPSGVKTAYPQSIPG